MKRVLIVCARNYFPLDGGDKQVSLGLVKHLSKSSELSIFNILDEKSGIEQTNNQLIKFCKKAYCFYDPSLPLTISVLLSFILFIPFYKIRRQRIKTRKKLLKKIIHEIKPDRIIWDHLRSTCYFVENESNNYLLQHNNEVKIYQEKISRYPAIARLFLSIQVHLLKREMYSVFNIMDKIVYLNKDDIQGQRNDPKEKHLEYIMPEFKVNDYKISDKKIITLLFIGRLDWYANSEGIIWFVQNVMPRLPECFNLSIVGKNPDEKLEKVVSEVCSVKLFPNVEYIKPYFEQADIFVSPIFSGSGINIKILEAASYSMPIVLTNYSKRGYSQLDFLEECNSAEDFIRLLLRLASTSLERLKLSTMVGEWYLSYLENSSDHIKNIFLGD